MYNNKSFLAIIPARSGSKGLKDKNIMDLNGKPMLAYTIETALRSGLFDEIIVSTDSQKYADIAIKYGAQVPFLRPEHLSTDTATSADVIIDVLKNMKILNKEYDYFMLLQPTSPLRDEQDIKEAIELLFQKDANAVVSVCETEHSPLYINTLDETLSMDNFISKGIKTRRQDLPKYYRLNGAIYLCNVDYFLKYNHFYNYKSFAYIMDKRKSIDIDDELDFKIAESILLDGGQL